MKRPWALPLAPLYAGGWALRELALRLGIERVRRLALPVLSVGSLSAGGAGKTPFVIALATLLKATLFTEGRVGVDVLSRGYGRRERGAAWVQANGSAAMYGDEPLLIAREAQVMVYIGERRIEAGLLAESLGSGVAVHLLDDGFQHRQLARDLNVVLVSSEDLEDWLLPAGDRREPLRALRRAGVLAVPVEDDAAVERMRGMGLRQPVWRYRREMVVPEIGGPIVAFCAIARPGQFFAGLERAGMTIAARRAFRDHHSFESRDFEGLRHLMKHSGAQGFVTTAKDHIRMGETVARLGAPVFVAGLRVVFQDETAVAAWLLANLASISPPAGNARVRGDSLPLK